MNERGHYGNSRSSYASSYAPSPYVGQEPAKPDGSASPWIAPIALGLLLGGIYVFAARPAARQMRETMREVREAKTRAREVGLQPIEGGELGRVRAGQRY